MLGKKQSRSPSPSAPNGAAIQRETADRLIRQHQEKAPVDVLAIASAFGVNVYKEDLGPHVSGLIRWDKAEGGPSGYVVIVHSGHHPNRQRFTVAHELAHFVLHCPQGGRLEIKDDTFYRALSGPLEREANDLAADILMPWGLINGLIEAGQRSLDQLAKALGVSKQAMAIRLGLPYDQNWE